MSQVSVAPCPFCGRCSSRICSARDYFVKRGNSPEFDVLYCAECKIGFSMPYLSEAELSQYYPATFEAYSKAPSIIRVLKRIKYAFDLRSILREIHQGLKTPLTFFEIGAGKGDFLYYLHSQGFRVAGLEPSEYG